MLGQRRGRWASIGSAFGRGRVCWVCRQAPKRNNKFRLIHSLYCPQEPFNNINYKAIDTTSIRYQLLWLWLCRWRGDISSCLSSCLLDPSSLLQIGTQLQCKCVPICNNLLQIGTQLHCKCVSIYNNLLQFGTQLPF